MCLQPTVVLIIHGVVIAWMVCPSELVTNMMVNKWQAYKLESCIVKIYAFMGLRKNERCRWRAETRLTFYITMLAAGLHGHNIFTPVTKFWNTMTIYWSSLLSVFLCVPACSEARFWTTQPFETNFSTVVHNDWDAIFKVTVTMRELISLAWLVVGLLCSGSRSQQTFAVLFNVCLGNIFWTTEPFVTSLVRW